MDQESIDNSNPKQQYADNVMEKLIILLTTGRSYRRQVYKLEGILLFYIDQMRAKFSNMGEKYITNMIIDVENIFKNVSSTSQYDTLEFVNTVIEYCFKTIAYKYTKKEKPYPQLPDYTLAEIKDLAKSISK